MATIVCMCINDNNKSVGSLLYQTFFPFSFPQLAESLSVAFSNSHFRIFPNIDVQHEVQRDLAGMDNTENVVIVQQSENFENE